MLLFIVHGGKEGGGWQWWKDGKTLEEKEKALESGGFEKFAGNRKEGWGAWAYDGRWCLKLKKRGKREMVVGQCGV